MAEILQGEGPAERRPPPVRLARPEPSLTVRCRGCGEEAELRRGRCPRCYDRWLAARPVGVGASCAACGDRRMVHLRHFELHRLWVVLCHNCTAHARTIQELPRSVEKLVGALRRERRGGDRRLQAASESGWYEYVERRRRGRRAGDHVERTRVQKMALLAAEDVGEIIEIEADYALPIEDQDPEGVPITDVHMKIDPAEL